MITYAWQAHLAEVELAEVDALVGEAVRYDAEAGFSTADPWTPRDGLTRHLIVTMPPRGQRESPDLDRLPDVSVVAYLRVDVDAGEGWLQFVVHPAFRSLGIGTLLFERLRDEGGWQHIPGLASVQVWAHGNHPAADRMARRLGAGIVGARFKTLRFLGGSEDFVPAERDLDVEVEATEILAAPLDGHLAGMAPADVDVLSRDCRALSAGGAVVGFGTHGSEPAVITLSAPDYIGREPVRALLTRALLAVQSDGARVAQLYLDPLAAEVLSASRELGFQHDQTDLHYLLALAT